MSHAQSAALLSALESLWETVYGKPIGDLAEDLSACRTFFDPVTRGHTLRVRLAELNRPSEEVYQAVMGFGEPLVTAAGAGGLIPGIEARLVIDVLRRLPESRERAHVPASVAESAHLTALETYRRWSRHRLDQVLALQSGAGAEVMQAKSVGVVVTLLVNRSDCVDRAVGRVTDRDVSDRIDEAIHAAAGAFADQIAKNRGRSLHEQRLVGGHWLTEARRRLAHRLMVHAPAKGETSYVYIPAEYREEVIDFLGRDLARRGKLQRETVERGFDALVDAFRASAITLAGQGMVFERPADTSRLRRRLIESFDSSREG